MSVDTLRSLSLFDGLTDDQFAELVGGGTEVRVEPGVDLFREGAPADHWFVLIEGSLDLIRHLGREDLVVGRMDLPGRWAGGFRAWDNHGVYLATGRGVADGRVFRLPAERLRDWCSAWFPFGVHLIEGLFGTARSIESTARQRGSLITLGRLAAGLAHEINNPAAAASRAVEALQGAGQVLTSAPGRLASGEIPAAQFMALDALRRQIDPGIAVRDPLDLADLEDALSSWLTEHGVDRAWDLAPQLAAAGADLAWCERAASVLPGSALAPGLEWVASTATVEALLSELKESTRRISELVAAVKSYSQMDRGSMQYIDVTEGLDSTLVMMGHKIGNGVTVVRDYGADVPRVEAYAAELNQVWTNLIDNAVDALGGAGTLRLTTRADGDHVAIEIGDTGAGMPPQVAARAFEPFFTTKDAGTGTGLGLDTAWRIIVERHGGTITIEPRPGETVLRVRIPSRRAFAFGHRPDPVVRAGSAGHVEDGPPAPIAG